jgi:RHS repeat-associated protein
MHVTYPDSRTQAFQYDPAGNRLRLTDSISGTTTYSYDPADRLLSLTDASGLTTFAWDNNGNMLAKIAPSGTVSYTYDSANRLIQVQTGATTAQYTYDGDGRRTRKIINGAAETHAFDLSGDLSQLLASTDSAGTSAYLRNGSLLYGFAEANQQDRYYLVDALGSIRGLADLLGELEEIYSYDAFGSLRSSRSIVRNAPGFAGEEFDTETGLIYLRARYYDPSLGRFISRDTLSALVDIQSAGNSFRYADNNPALLTDPSGHIAFNAAMAIIGAVSSAGWYMIEQRVIKHESVDTKVLLGKAAAGALSGFTGGLLFTVGRELAAYGIEHLISDQPMSLGDAAAETFTGVFLDRAKIAYEALPGKYVPTLKATKGQLSLFDNSVGATASEYVWYNMRNELVLENIKFATREARAGLEQIMRTRDVPITQSGTPHYLLDFQRGNGRPMTTAFWGQNQTERGLGLLSIGVTSGPPASLSPGQ